MTFPTIPTGTRVVTGVDTAGGTTRTFPSLTGLTKNAGDLLIAIIIIYDGNSTNAEFSSWGGGFTEFGDFATTTTVSIGCAYKISDGTETGTFTVTVADASATDSAFFLLSIPGAVAPPEAGGFATGANANADPGSLDPTGWGTEDTLWIAVAGCGEDTTGGSFTALASAPANYSDYAETGISADVVGGIEGAVAFRQLNAASEDPGTFTNDASNTRWGAITIAVRPAFSMTPTVGSLTTSGIAPTVVQDIKITPTVGALATAGQTPAVGLGSSIIPSTGSTVLGLGYGYGGYGVQGYGTPRYQFPQIVHGTVITPSVGSLETTGVTAVVSLGTKITPTVGSLAIAGVAPLLGILATPSTASLVTAGVAPIVRQDYLITPGVGTLTTTGQTGTTAQSTVLTPDVGTLLTTGQTSSLVRGDAITVPVGALTTTGVQAIIGQGIIAITGGVTLTGVAPTLVIGTNITPTVGTVALAGQTSTVQHIRLAQSGFRWRDDNGSETTASWLQAQNTDATRSKNVNVRLRMIVSTKFDPTARNFQIEYRKVGDSTWRKVA